MRPDILLEDIRAQFFFVMRLGGDGMGMTVAEGDRRIAAVCCQKEERTV